MNKPHIVIVGSGVAGLSALWHLKNHARITILEQADYLGGHTHTHNLSLEGEDVKVDSGFIVFNDKTYPGIIDWFNQLGVTSHPTDMSFSVSLNHGEFEWSGTSINSIFAQKRRLLDLKFWRMLIDIIKFNYSAKKQSPSGCKEFLASASIGDYLKSANYGSYFENGYLLPMAGSIWSCPSGDVRKFPYNSFITFCENHGLLSIFNRPTWYSIKGGSNQYIKSLLDRTKKCDLNVLTESKVECVKENKNKNTIIFRDRHNKLNHIECNAVVLATHADSSRQIISKSSHPSLSCLNDITFRDNTAYLHSDQSLMPRNRKAWAAWNYVANETTTSQSEITVTYFMNKLQHLSVLTPIFVTLNPPQKPATENTFRIMKYRHPLMTNTSEKATKQLSSYQGQKNIWFAGAWLGNGFHESGYKSGQLAAQQIVESLIPNV